MVGPIGCVPGKSHRTAVPHRLHGFDRSRRSTASLVAFQPAAPPEQSRRASTSVRMICASLCACWFPLNRAIPTSLFARWIANIFCIYIPEDIHVGNVTNALVKTACDLGKYRQVGRGHGHIPVKRRVPPSPYALESAVPAFAIYGIADTRRSYLYGTPLADTPRVLVCGARFASAAADARSAIANRRSTFFLRFGFPLFTCEPLRPFAIDEGFFIAIHHQQRDDPPIKPRQLNPCDSFWGPTTVLWEHHEYWACAKSSRSRQSRGCIQNVFLHEVLEHGHRIKPVVLADLLGRNTAISCRSADSLRVLAQLAR